MKKKFFFINTTFGGGGAPKVARDLYSHLNAGTEYEAYFAYGRGPKTDDPRAIKIGNVFEFLVHLLLVRAFGLEGLGSYFSTRKLIRIIQKQKPEIIHLHNLHGYYLNFASLFAFLKTLDVPIVWTLHDEWAMTSLRAHSTGCTHCKTGVGTCTSMYTYPKAYTTFFLPWMLRRKHEAFSGVKNLNIIAPAQWLAESAKKSFLGQYPIHTVHNGIEADLFASCLEDKKKEMRRVYGLPTEKTVVLFSAHKMSDVNKGIGYVLSAAQSLEKSDAFFVGIGSMPDPGIGNVKIMGYVNDRKKLAELYGLADLFVFPSVAETFSLVLLEAMASGLAIVGFAIPAFQEIVDTEIGILVPPRDQKQLTAAVAALVADKKQMAVMGQAGRKRVVAHFTHRQFIEGYVEIYGKLC